MSITESMQSGVASLKSAAAFKPNQPRRNRIRRGQKLDEVVSVSEQRLSQIASGTGQGKTSTSAASTSLFSASGAPGPSASSSSNNAGGDSPFQLQEYLAMLVRRDPHNVEAITSLPTEADIESLTTTDKGKSKDDTPASSDDDSIFQNVDTDVWVYEQLRRLVLDLTTPWLTSLQLECDKHLRPSTCAAMNAGDWMYLCASHGEEKQCCAIDYMPSQAQEQPAAAAALAASVRPEVDAVGLVPPPAPSPRPTAILSRPDHEEGDQDDAPAWTTFAQQSRSAENDEDDEDEEEEEEGAVREEGDADDQIQKLTQRRGEDDDATINLRSSGSIAGLSSANPASASEESDKEEATTAGEGEMDASDAKEGEKEEQNMVTDVSA
ncbi:hypothetical protein NDA16_001104 [Ustilago loliicola]|nr:hypothetical protein NDA16_001104 [Ustilago loliicola]